MVDRARARELAAEYLGKDDPTGWFEQLYREAENGESNIPWADLRPNPNLIRFWNQRPIPSTGKAAITIGCGLGDDAEKLAEWGYDTTAFDISTSAIGACKKRFPQSKVNYVASDLLSLPPRWEGRFDLVLESYTLQVLPEATRRQAMQSVADLAAERGYVLVITRGREEEEAEGKMPWPLTRRELGKLAESGLREISFEDYVDDEDPPVRRFRALYQK